MSFIIHTIGVVACGTFAVSWMKSLYRDATRDSNQPLHEELHENHYLVADTVGLCLVLTGYWLDRVEDATDKLFNSRLMQWVNHKCEKLKLKPDGEYVEFKYSDEHHGGWNGYVTDKDKPKFKPAKYEMEA